ncbi:hypothetical protein [Kaistella sp.]|uniref:hypothetical protein n=1 Tax=Kaistella sp. TaxID=2782235 RepID=UPI0035A001D5
MENNKALNTVVNNLDLLEFNSEQKSDAEQFSILVGFIDDLIRNDFNRLVSILYRVDISETKLKQKLAENTDNTITAAETIARLFIEREAEKILSREKYRSRQ